MNPNLFEELYLDMQARLHQFHRAMLDQLEQLYGAIRHGNMDRVRAILDPLSPGCRQLLINCQLLDDAYNGNALHMACRHYHPDNCECHRGNWCRSGATTPNLIEITQYLLDSGANPRTADYYGMAPVQLAKSDTCLFSNPAPEIALVIERHLGELE